MPLIEGQVLEGKYEIVRLLARGGMGDVYLGTHRRIAKPVAIKVLGSELAQEAAAVERFEREARVAPRIRSAHVAETYDLGDLPTGERFIVMELLEGETLGQRLDREHHVAEPALAAMAVQILDALASAHEAGVVHRDLKPENVFLTKRDGRDFVKVVDFGVSKVLDMTPDEKRLTVAGALVGTPAYMSPEQARGKAVDHRTDLYALGIILYEATAGASPFDAENLNDMLFRIALDPVPPLASASRELAAIVEKATAKSPEDRYRTAAEMREDVLAWQEACGPAPGARTSGTFSVPPRETDAAMLTPRPWSVPPGEDADVDFGIPRRWSAGWFVAMAMIAGLVVIGVMRPGELRAVSSDLAGRAAAFHPGETKAPVTPPALPPTSLTITTTALPPAAPSVVTAPKVSVAHTVTPPRVAPPPKPAQKVEPTRSPTTTATATAEPSAAPVSLAPEPSAPPGKEETIY